MRDPLDELRNLSAHTSGPALSPAEVRRRGDRMRRRRTVFQAVGAAAAVAVIATGGTFVTTNLTSAEPPVGPAGPASTSPTPTPTPAASPEPAPEGGWLTEPPQGFPLDAFLPESPRESGDAMLFACSDSTTLPVLDTAVYSEGVWVPGPEQQDRHLYLFPSGTQARTAYESVREAWRGCPPSPLEAGAEFRFEVTDGRPDRFWVFREAYDASGEAAPELGAAAIYEVRLYGNALFAASIWEPSGESPLLTDAGADFDNALTQIDAASCVFLSGGCGDDVDEPASSPWTTEVPEGFPLEQGLPAAGGDVPEWSWSDGADVPLSAVACGGPEDLSSTEPVDSLRVEASPPDENAWRHLLLFADDASASQAYAIVRSSAVVCGELSGQPSPEDPAEMRWAVGRSEGVPAVLEIDGQMYADGTDVRVPGRVMTRVVRVGNALLVARVDDSSSASGEDDGTRELEAQVRSLTEQMCVFAEEPCDGA